LAADLFTRFLTLGPGRNFQELSRQTGLSAAALASLAQKERWIERAEEVDVRARLLYMDEAAASVAQVTRDQLAIAYQLQLKGLAALAQMPITSVRDALNAIKLSVEMQRKALYLDEQGTSTEEKVADLMVEKLKKIWVESKEEQPFSFDPSTSVKELGPPPKESEDVPA